jgi:hypothetical protein
MTRFLTIALVVLSIGCGSSHADTLRQHTLAAVAVRGVNEAGAELLEGECERQAVGAAESGDTVAAAEIAVGSVLRRCEQLVVTQHTVATAYEGWTRMLLLMAVKEMDFDREALMHLALEVVRLYGDLATAIEAWADVDMPNLPAVVGSLMGEE